jgi:glycosyltransferase involved in cell wall biosynthesis
VKIAVLSNAAVIHTRRWVEHFRARGHEVRVWSLEPGPPELGAERLPSAPLPGVLRYPLAAGALRRALDRFAPDLVDAHYVPNYGVLATLVNRHPRVITAWGSDLLVAGRRDPFQRARAWAVLSSADHVLCDSGNLAAAARALGAPADRVSEIPWGVDLSRFAPGVARQRGLLFSARMHEPVYDLPTLFAGAADVMRERSSVELAIAGDGTLRSELERLAARVLPAGRYRFLGRLDPQAMAGWLSRADVYLSASRSDSTSVSLLEAMAAGAVPVVSDLEGNREWIAPGDGGVLFPTGDAVALAAAVRQVLDDAAFADAARARNRRVVEARGDWNANLARVEAIYRELVERHIAGAR